MSDGFHGWRKHILLLHSVSPLFPLFCVINFSHSIIISAIVYIDLGFQIIFCYASMSFSSSYNFVAIEYQLHLRQIGLHWKTAFALRGIT